MASDPSFSSWAGGGGGGAQRYGGGEASSAMELSKELNRQITQASSMQELMHLCLTNFDKLNAVRQRGAGRRHCGGQGRSRRRPAAPLRRPAGPCA